MNPGLVSVTFRKLTVPEVISACVRAGCSVIEWGGDIHVPAGDLKAARETRKQSIDAGLQIYTYGSYYRLDSGSTDNQFLRCIDTAKELGAPRMRIWAGTKGSAQTGEDERKILTENLRLLLEIGVRYSIDLIPEFHGNTLTDDPESVRLLMKDIPELMLYWQPRWDWNEQKRLDSLSIIGERLAGMHVFTWEHKDGEVKRKPLREGEHMWKKAFDGQSDELAALLEFVWNDSLEAFYQDADTLKGWLTPHDA